MPGFIVKMDNFGGEIPALDNRLLPDNQASVASNTWLFSGRVEPIHSLVAIHTMKNPEALSFFRLPAVSASLDDMGNSYWLEFENQNIRVVASPVAGQDQGSRYYWADGVYPKMMTGDMIKNANQTPPVAPSTPYRMGTPLPTIPPVVAPHSGTSTINETRAYTYSWVSDFGEEGPPAFPGVATGKLDDTWTITVTPPSTAERQNRVLTHTRIYRSVTGVQGVASYFFVTELPISTTTFDDIYTDADIVLNEQLGSLDWFPPPDDLQGLVSMPNGMIAGWRENEVWFCEPYYPHAWPLKYMIAVPTQIIGLGVLGQTLIILTDGHPWSATGIEPSSMALAIIQPLEACTSRLSIVNTPGGVLYSSPNGLINVTAAGAQNLTKEMILKDQWAKSVDLNTLCAATLTQGYYAYSIAGSNVFQPDAFQFDDPATATVDEQAFQEKIEYGARPGLFISLGDARIAKVALDAGTSEVKNIVTDIFNGEVMVLRDVGGPSPVVYHVDVRQQQAYAKYRWRSKMFKAEYVLNMGAAKVYWTPPFITPEQDTLFRVFAGSTSQEIEDGLPLRFEQKLGTSGQMYRLPSGFKSLYWQFEVEGYAIIDAIHAAQTAHDLRNV